LGIVVRASWLSAAVLRYAFALGLAAYFG
jgi:hypothetical protein